MSDIATLFGRDTHYARNTIDDFDKFAAGAELEVEDIKRFDIDFLEKWSINVTEDGSLRNNGHEFLLPPSNRDKLVERFNMCLTKGIKVGKEPYSMRTSTHVHVNMLNASEAQTKALLFLYAIFEPLAFSYVGQARKNNIHCVPLNMTHMPNVYKHTIEYIVARWHKYTALNLLPLAKLGTVEFRHLEGTGDDERFDTWLIFLETLWNEAMNMKEFRREYLLDLTLLKGIEGKLITESYKRNCVDPIDFVLEQNLMDVKLAFLG